MSDLKIPGFEMIEKLGQGGMATVWKARQISLDRTVAIKILSAQLSHDPSDIQRFQAEAQQAAKLKHPGIIQVYDASVESGIYYFVMEYVAGYTVGDWVRRKKVLSEKDALLVVECVSDALDYAWQNARIIHCDIKPDNIIIDSDGTVKLADLGLSRTINAMSSQVLEEEVMGTPAYISPEQAMGMPDLDCRADIYSLGAMLYHLVTGKLLFEGKPDNQIMEMQVTGTVPDALDMNPKLSRSLCWLIEKMLAKKREDRHKDWTAVRADIAKVKKGLPILNPPPEGSSTVSRSTKRMKVVQAHPSKSEGDDKKNVSRLPRMAIAAVVVVVVGIVAYRLSPGLRGSVTTPRFLPAPTIPPKPVPTGASSPDRAASEMFDSARKWAAENPDRFDMAMERFRKVADQTKGTRFSAMAEDEMRRLTAARQSEIDRIMKNLADDSAGLIREERFDEAARLYETYAGPGASDTAKKRIGIASELRVWKDRKEESKRRNDLLVEKKMTDLLDRIVLELTTAGLESARKIAMETLADEELKGKQEAIKTVKGLLDDASTVDQKIIESFKASRDQDVTVQLNEGARKLRIVDVRDGKVMGQQRVDAGGATATIAVTFEVKDLSARERLSRMGSEEAQNDVALVKGLMALSSKAYPHARKYFGMTHPLLADRLVASVGAVEKKQEDEEARAALAAVLKMMGIMVEQFDAEAWTDAVNQRKISSDLAPKILEGIANFRNKHGNTNFAKEAEPVVQSIDRACQGGEGSRSGIPSVKPAPLSAKLAEMVGDKDAIVDFLLKRNPEIRSKDVVVRSNDDGKVVHVEIVSENLVDIGPVAAFRDLREFACGAVSPRNLWRTEPMCKLGDISALRGMPLESVSIALAYVRDLSPFRGMPLRVLRIRNCPISDLSPLKDMATIEELMMRNTEIKEISALKGLKLKRVDIGGTRVFDLRPLSGMSLEYLDITDTQVKDISMLKDMPIDELILAKTRIYNFSVLKGMPLKTLNVDETQFKDLALLKGMPLKSLHLANNGIADVSQLQGLLLNDLSLAGALEKDYSSLADMPIHCLNLSGSRVEDIAFIKDMPIESLDISNTKVSDLSPLKDTRLISLSINGTRVKDLRPIADLSLRYLNCQNIPAANFDALRRMPIRDLYISDPDGAVRPVLRTMSDLEEVNGVSVRQR